MILDYGPRELKSLQIAWCTSALDFLFRSEHNVEWSKNTIIEFLPDENEPKSLPGDILIITSCKRPYSLHRQTNLCEFF